jgi:secreted trypsin-like serine protease
MPDSNTCTYAPGANKSICIGDGGGPITTQAGVVYGITSFVSALGCTNGPSGFTTTSAFSDLITTVRTCTLVTKGFNDIYCF